MDHAALKKSPEIIMLLNELREHLGRDAFCIVDHWEADLDAIGIGSPYDRRVLAYVSCFGKPEGRYDVELETPTRFDDGPLYRSQHEDVDSESLTGLIASHLRNGRDTARIALASETLENPNFEATVADVGRYLDQPAVPVRRGSVKFIGSWPDQSALSPEPNSQSIAAAHWDVSNGFGIGYELRADVSSRFHGQTQLAEADMCEVRLWYTDVLLEFGRNETPIEDLIAQLRHPENRVICYCIEIPGGEVLEFPRPLISLMLKGSTARPALLAHLDDLEIRNEVVLALGVVGDEATIPLLIERYPKIVVPWDHVASLPRICLSFALTRLTGLQIDRDREGTHQDEASANKWETWWKTNSRGFRIPTFLPNTTWMPGYPSCTHPDIERARELFASGRRITHDSLKRTPRDQPKDDATLEKTPAVMGLLRRLRERMGSKAFRVLDHWDDPDAIGVGSVQDARLLAYVCMHGKPEGRFYVELEVPPASFEEAPLRVVARHEDLDFESLINVIASHLARGDSPNV